MPQIGLTSRSAPKQNLYSRCRLHEIGRLEILSGVSDQRAVARIINGPHPGNDVYQPGIMMVDMFHEFGFRVRRTGDENSASVRDRLGDVMEKILILCRVPAA